MALVQRITIMPVDGIPDSKIHRFCIRCRKWCWPDEGSDYDPRRRPLPVQLARDIAGLKTSRFRCHRCAAYDRRIRYFVFGSLAALVALALTLVWLGVLR